MVVLVVVAEDRDRLAERRPDVVVVDAGRHHPDHDLHRARLRYLHLLDLEGVAGLALALLADHPGGHRVRELARLGRDAGDVGGVNWHGLEPKELQNQSCRLIHSTVARITVGTTSPPTPNSEEVGPRLHAVDEPAEVLAEEAGDQRPDDEERGHHAEPGGGPVHPLGAGVEVDPGERGQVVVLALELAADLREVVADVAQVLARAAAEAGELEDPLGGGLELVALAGDQPLELVHLLLAPVDAPQQLAPGPLEHVGLERGRSAPRARRSPGRRRRSSRRGCGRRGSPPRACRPARARRAAARAAAAARGGR